INLRIEEYAMRYITDHNRKVDLRGPVFLTVRSVILGQPMLPPPLSPPPCNAMSSGNPRQVKP
uniref:hypothetical protein n=1 Tax=Methanoculleus thermophilus TaxID=2200 RepID=UPI000A6A2F91